MKLKHFFCILIVSLSFNYLFSEVYKSKATVSFYAEDFHGKKTSNGEIYDMNSLTCASKELPFNTKLRVTNLANNKSVIVRVNDRGPFVPNRDLDLSKAAARRLDMIVSGTATVKIEVVEWGKDTKLSRQTADKAALMMKQRFPDSKPTNVNTTNSVKKTIPENKIWDIQLGAYTSRENADELAQTLLREGFKNVVFQKSNGIIRVVIREVSSNELQKVEGELQKKGHSEYTVRERKTELIKNS